MSPLESELFEGLPAKCIESCPRLKPLYTELHTTDVVSNALLEEGMAPHNAGDMPDDIVRTIGEQINRPLDPSNQEDRKTAVRFLVGLVFEAAHDSMQELLAMAKIISEDCMGNGPLKARVFTDCGNIVLKLCRSDIAATKRLSRHTGSVSLQLEDD